MSDKDRIAELERLLEEVTRKNEKMREEIRENERLREEEQRQHESWLEEDRRKNQEFTEPERSLEEDRRKNQKSTLSEYLYNCHFHIYLKLRLPPPCPGLPVPLSTILGYTGAYLARLAADIMSDKDRIAELERLLEEVTRKNEKMREEIRENERLREEEQRQHESWLEEDRRKNQKSTLKLSLSYLLKAPSPATVPWLAGARNPCRR
ncbi:hypothetical protein MAJ_10011, partial [Metarhizium majus ARSEF 297]